MTVQTRRKHIRACLSLAGSDPSGGAGIQADLKTFSALGCYGAAAVTALTVQNSLGVVRSVPVEAELVYAQGAAVMDDLRPRAVKIGMTCTSPTIRALARLLRDYTPPFAVLDPVMVSSSGRRLLADGAVETLTRELMPLCTLITPNLPELEVLTGTEEPEEGARRLQALTGCPNILAKGGHADGAPTDILLAGGATYRFRGTRIATSNTHGTGCTLSAAIAAYVALGHALPEAVDLAKRYVEQALAAAANLHMGRGHGAVNHFFAPLPLRTDEAY